ncbi:RNA polymerase sigma factor [Mucilaginibacter pedocola]|uniref:RNA polymerase subunit sigma-24 n=1 Tax=Mucilaginibacter pedocola TaxID=1792845 RepID=A0A1S9PB10_9SPHI|nr:sigma-70 family RNA polymerase sigma factor [Mucilaginibacter pedocola]OOQ57788.1 RNA polymerase subunit sigma-24 [Mucilaginibacter pedocola]
MIENADVDFLILFSAARQEDTQAFKQIYQRYWKMLYLSACKRVDEDEAQDMVQEIMLSLWKRKNSIIINSETDLERYLHKALKYRIISFYANDATKVPLAEWFDPSFDPHIESAFDVKGLKEVIDNEINLMPQRMQLIFNLSRRDDFSIADIAGHLNLSEQTVKNQLTTAIKRLKTGISKYNHTDVAVCSIIAVTLFGA